eukprot:810782_1
MLIEKEEKKTNSMKEELSDSDGDIHIKLSDDLKKQIQTSSTGWQTSDWRDVGSNNNNNGIKKKTLFNLGLNIDIILKRLYVRDYMAFILLHTPYNILQKQITKDLDCGIICKCYLYKYNKIKIQTLSELNNNWNQDIKDLKQHSAQTYQQLLSTSYQTKRLDIKALKTLKKNRKRHLESEEKLLTGLFFGNENENEQKGQQQQEQEEKEKEEEKQEVEQVFVVIARSSG